MKKLIVSLTLGLSLGYVIWAQGQGMPATQFVPVTMLITAGVYLVSALLTFALLKERAVPQARLVEGGGVRASFARLHRTWQDARRYRDFVWLMATAVAYQKRREALGYPLFKRTPEVVDE